MNILGDKLVTLSIVYDEHRNGDDRTQITAKKIYSSKFSDESSTQIKEFISEVQSLENYLKRPKKTDLVFMPP